MNMQYGGRAGGLAGAGELLDESGQIVASATATALIRTDGRA